MSSLTFIRHAETDMAGTFCGHSDPSINQQGRLQIKSLIDHLGGKGIDAIYSSDLRRAHETAQELSLAFSVPIIVMRELREIDFGDWEGLSWHTIEQRDPVDSQKWLDAFPTLPTPRGELYSSFRKRVLAAIDNLLALEGARNIAVVTHAGVMRVVLQALLGYREQDAWEKTSSYCCFFEYGLEASVRKVIQ